MLLPPPPKKKKKKKIGKCLPAWLFISGAGVRWEVSGWPWVVKVDLKVNVEVLLN
jgi:hypothetical protein